MNHAAGASDPVALTTSVAAALLLIAAVVGIAARQIRLPYTTALVVVGLALSALNVFGDVHLSAEAIYLGFLPPLLFEGALNVDLGELHRRRFQVGVLAVPGTLLAAAVTASALVALGGLPLRYAAVLAIILAPTDPVTVLALVKETGVVKGLRTLLEGESLFNDAVAASVTVVAVEIALAAGAGPSIAHSARILFEEVVVGVAVGVAVGLVAHRLMATVDDYLIEATLSLVSAYGSFLVADQLHGSGLLAVIVAGLLVANFATDRSMTSKSRASVVEFWEVVAFLANSALFLLIGLTVQLHEISERKTLVATLIAIVASTLGRAASTALVTRARDVPRQWLAALWWGGLRGGIPIALVLGLPIEHAAGVNLTAVVFAAVLWSLLVPGSTYRWLLRRSGLLP